MQEWPLYLWAVLIAILLSALSLLFYICHLYWLSNIYVFLMYIAYTIVLATILTTMSYIFSKGTHFHHYFNGLLAMSFCGHHSFLISAIHGLLNGMFIEGCARWAMDPVWEIKKDKMDDNVREWMFGVEDQGVQSSRKVLKGRKGMKGDDSEF